MQDESLCGCELCVQEGLAIRIGYCHCDCGDLAPISPMTVRKLGYIAGKPRTFIRNHDKRQRGPRYEEKDLGYRTPCWVFKGHISPKGYGQMRRFGDVSRMYPAHVVFYEEAKGPVPDGKQLDHLCHDPDTCINGVECPHRACVNPDHLDPKTNQENSYRGATRPGSKHKPGRKPKAKQTHCKRGHEFTPENTIIGSDGGRRCRVCDNAAQRRSYYKRAAREGVNPGRRMGDEP